MLPIRHKSYAVKQLDMPNLRQLFTLLNSESPVSISMLNQMLTIHKVLFASLHLAQSWNCVNPQTAAGHR